MINNTKPVKGIIRIISVVCLVLVLSGGNYQVYANSPLTLSGGNSINRTVTGYQPLPADVVVHSVNSKVQPRYSSYQSAMPSSYDSRNVAGVNYINPIRNQGSWGTCWAFASIGIAEASLKRQGIGTYDLSELQHAYFTYHTVADSLGNTTGDSTYLPATSNFLTSGGNVMVSAYVLASMIGASNETSVPYNTAAPAMVINNIYARGYNTAHLDDYYEVLLSDTQAVKQLIISNGAVSISYYAETSNESAYFNSATGAYYDNYHTSSNHAVTVVGWDDNYSRSNFVSNNQPVNNGAWLVRNSWGTGWGNAGYFWLSYETLSLQQGGQIAAAFNMSTEDHLNVYQYDGSASRNYYYYYNKGYMANIFTAAANEEIDQVGIFTGDTNMTYKISIYLNPTTNPTSGTLVGSSVTNGTLTYQGYHTIDLTNVVELTAGQKFSVVLELSKTGSYVDLMVDTTDSWSWLNFTSVSSANQSYISSSGTSWNDISATGDQNARIKVFTQPVTPKLDSSITLNNDLNKTYNGSSSIAPDLTIVGDGQVTIEYKVKSASDSTYTVNRPITANQYTMRVMLSGTNQYYALVKTFDFTISKATSSIFNIRNQSKVYDGKAVVLPMFDSTGSTSYSIAYKNLTTNYTGTALPIAAGNYQIIITLNETTNYLGTTATQDFTISKAVSSITNISNVSKTYDGTPVSAPTFTRVGDGFVTYYYKLQNAQDDEYSTVAPSAVGNYNVKIVMAEGNNYQGTVGIASFVISALPPVTPKGQVTSVSHDQLQLSWSVDSNATAYEVYRSTISNGIYEWITTTSDTSYLDNDLVTGTTYYYQLRALNDSGETTIYSGFSAPVSGKPIPSTPIVKATSVNYNTIGLSWDAIDGVSGYEVYRATSYNGTYTRIATLNNSQLTYNSTSLTTGTTYYYKVRAFTTVNAINIYGSYSAYTYNKGLPSTPTISVASYGYNSLRVSWNVVSGASGYVIYRATSLNGTYSLVTTLTSGSSSYSTQSGLVSGATYYFKVRAYRLVGYTKVYGGLSTVESAMCVVATPTLSGGPVGYDTIKVNWNAISGANGYELYSSNTIDGDYNLVTTSTGLTYNHSGLVSGQTYYYKIRAYRLINNVKVYGGLSSPLTILLMTY